MNKRKLLAAMVEAGQTQKSLAQRIGISTNSMSHKVNGGNQFTIEEATAICDVLNITDDATRAQIFLR